MVGFRISAVVLLSAEIVWAALKEYNTDQQITSDVTWAAADTINLNAQVFVKNGATLTIEAGTTIHCKYTPSDTGGQASNVNDASVATASHAAALVIERGAKIMAQGTASSPITFTSDAVSKTDPALSELGTWGGVIVLGRAPVNGCDAETVADGESIIEGINNSLADAHYGGTNANDNSGILQYVRIWFGGAQLDAHNEINGLTLGGVGSGTTIDHIEIAYNLDDGIEFFGGTVDVSYLSLLYNRDDQVDIDCGYIGTIQHVFIAESKENGDHSFEIDGHNDCTSSSCNKAPRTDPTVSQVTVLGPSDDSGSCQHKSDQLIQINDGAGGRYVNMILTYSPKAGVVMDNDLTPVAATTYDASVPLAMHYYYYKVKDATGLPGGVAIESWDDHCMPEPCTPTTDLTKTDVKFSAGMSSASDLTAITVTGMASATYPGAFAPGASSWLTGFSLLDSYSKLENTAVCQAPVVDKVAVDGASRAGVYSLATVAMAASIAL